MIAPGRLSSAHPPTQIYHYVLYRLAPQPPPPPPCLLRQVQSGVKATGDGLGKRGGGRANQKGNKKKGKGRSGGGGKGNGGMGKKKESPTAGLLELRRAPGSPAVLVGRNNLQNERITFALARAHELWLHARGVAGAHVLLRLVSESVECESRNIEGKK